MPIVFQFMSYTGTTKQDNIIERTIRHHFYANMVLHKN